MAEFIDPEGNVSFDTDVLLTSLGKKQHLPVISLVLLLVLIN